MVEDKKWMTDTRTSNSSVEHSVSSFTNGTHSSLNSEVEEDELACSMEPSVRSYPYMHLNGQVSGTIAYYLNYLIIGIMLYIIVCVLCIYKDKHIE